MKLITAQKLCEKIGVKRPTGDKYISFKIFVPCKKDRKDNRTNLFWDGCVDVENFFRIRLVDRGESRKKIGERLRGAFGERNQKLIEKLNNLSDKTAAIRHFEKSILGTS